MTKKIAIAVERLVSDNEVHCAYGESRGEWCPALVTARTENIWWCYEFPASDLGIGRISLNKVGDHIERCADCFEAEARALALAKEVV